MLYPAKWITGKMCLTFLSTLNYGEKLDNDFTHPIDSDRFTWFNCWSFPMYTTSTLFLLYIQVFDIPLENCSHFTTCSSCTSSADPVCGWCALESTCSRQIYCHSGFKHRHWVQDEEQCIASISLDPPSIAVDSIHNVSYTKSTFALKGSWVCGRCQTVSDKACTIVQSSRAAFTHCTHAPQTLRLLDYWSIHMYTKSVCVCTSALLVESTAHQSRVCRG